MKTLPYVVKESADWFPSLKSAIGGLNALVKRRNSDVCGCHTVPVMVQRVTRNSLYNPIYLRGRSQRARRLWPQLPFRKSSPPPVLSIGPPMHPPNQLDDRFRCLPLTTSTVCGFLPSPFCCTARTADTGDNFVVHADFLKVWESRNIGRSRIRNTLQRTLWLPAFVCYLVKWRGQPPGLLGTHTPTRTSLAKLKRTV